MIKIVKKIIALSLTTLIVSTSSIGAFAQDNELFEDELRQDLIQDIQVPDSENLNFEDINSQIKEIYEYGEIVDSEETEFGTVYYIDTQYNNPIKKRSITPWDAIDIAMAGASWAELLSDPSLKNLGWAALDTAALAPFIPSTGYFRHGDKIKALRELAKTSKGKNAIKKAIKINKTNSTLAAVSKLAKNYKLNSSAYSHILKRHGVNRAASEKGGKFIASFDIKSGIRSTLTSDSVIKNNTMNREGYTFIKNFNKTIGYDGNRPLTKLKVVLNKKGEVVTAYPLK